MINSTNKSMDFACKSMQEAQAKLRRASMCLVLCTFVLETEGDNETANAGHMSQQVLFSTGPERTYDGRTRLQAMR
jgi:hypothetical protein